MYGFISFAGGQLNSPWKARLLSFLFIHITFAVFWMTFFDQFGHFVFKTQIYVHRLIHSFIIAVCLIVAHFHCHYQYPGSRPCHLRQRQSNSPQTIFLPLVSQLLICSNYVQPIPILVPSIIMALSSLVSYYSWDQSVQRKQHINSLTGVSWVNTTGWALGMCLITCLYQVIEERILVASPSLFWLTRFFPKPLSKSGVPCELQSISWRYFILALVS